jgi:TRAP-type C4-dicarboxylate transport system permease small subunit
MPEKAMANSGGTAAENKKTSLAAQLVKILSVGERAGAIISGTFVLIMMLMTTLDVICRYIFNSPIQGNYELQPLLLVGVVYLAVSSIQAKRSHISLDLFSSRLSKGNQYTFRLFGDLVFILFSAVICWQFAIATYSAWVAKDYFWGLVKFPLWPPYLMITLGTAMLTLRLVEGIVSNPLWHRQSGLSAPARYIRIFIVALVAALMLTGILYITNAHVAPETVGIIAIALFFILLFLAVPVSACMGLISIMGFWMLKGGTSALGIAGNTPGDAALYYHGCLCRVSRFCRRGIQPG